MYLLKIRKKEDQTNNINITLSNEYKEFEKLKELISYIYSNSVFIASYEIFEMKEFESEDISGIGNSSICIGSPNTQSSINIQA